MPLLKIRPYLINSGSFTGSFSGTGSYARRALTASYVLGGAAGSSGTSGANGSSGSSGASGTSGSSGQSGTAGSSGTSGSSGSSGTSGSSGSSGSSGTSGATGAPGSSGTSGAGAAGTQGTSGSSGVSGTATVQTGSIAKQTLWTNVTSGSTNTITGLSLSSNKWDVSVVEEWDAATLDQYYNSCSLLLHLNGSNGSTTITDNSKNVLTVTSVNGTAISTAQSKFGGASCFFDGTNDYLTTPNNSLFDLSSGDFTIEFWFNTNTLTPSGGGTAGYATILGKQNWNGSAGAGWGVWQFNQTIAFFWPTSTLNSISTGNVITATNTWYHIAVVRSGTATNNTKIYINGVQQAQGTPSSTNSTSALTIGGTNATFGWDNTYYAAGYIDELRITKGVARYTSNFTPQKYEFPNSRNQVLTKYVGLVGGIDDKYVDYGVQKLSDTSLKLTRLTYPNQPLVGSGSLSGSVDRVYVNVLDYTKVSVTSSYSLLSKTASYALNGGSGGGSTLRTGSTYPITSSFSRRAITASYALNGGTALVNQTMKYVSGSNLYVLSRSIVSPSDVLMSVNGVIQTPITDYTVSASSVTFTESYPSGSKINARYLVAATNSSDVNLANIVLTGTTTGDAYYPQVAALLHFDGTNGSTTITDNSKNNLTVTATNGAAISTAQSKFGGASVLFDGTNDYLDVNSSTSFRFGTGDFTVEFWIKTSSTNFNILNPSSNTGAGYWGLLVFSGNLRWNDAYDVTNLFAVSASPILDNNWHHVAIVRSSGYDKVYFDGISQITQADSTDYGSSSSAWRIGSGNIGFLNGYIDELRITNGYARYTGAFTPPTAAFSNTGGDVGKALVVNSTATGVSIGTAGYFSSQLAKAWVNFNGTGTVAIRDSYNVSSITDNGTGDYTVNYSTALNNSNYCALGSSRVVIGTRTSVVGFSNYTTTSIRLETINLTNNLQDEDTNCVSIFSN